MAASSLPKDPAVARAMATLVFSRMSSRSLPALQRPEHFEATWVQHTHSPRADKFKAARQRNGFLGSTVLIKPGTEADMGGVEVSEPPPSLAKEQQLYKRPSKVEAPKLLSRTGLRDGGVQLPALVTGESGIRANHVTQPMSMRTPHDARDDEGVALESVSKAEETSAIVDKKGAEAEGASAAQLSALSHPTRDAAGVNGGVSDPQASAGPVHGSPPGPVASGGAPVLSEAERFDREVARHHQVLQAKVKTRFGELRRAFRMIDQDFSGACDRGELKHMLNAMFNLDIPEMVMDRLIDLADHDGDGEIKFAEFARIFTADDVRSMKKTLTADVGNFDTGWSKMNSRQPIGARIHNIKTYMSHFPAGALIPVNDAWEGPKYIPRKLLSSRGPRLEAPAREKNLGGFHPHKPHPGMPAGRSTGQHKPFTLDWETVPEFGALPQ